MEIEEIIHTPRQKEIIESVRKIITSKGMEKLTIRELADDLNLTEGAIYRHFKSKRDIIRLLIKDIETTLLTAVSTASDQEQNPAKKLENIFSSHLSYAEQRKGVSFIIINETLSLKDKQLQSQMFNVILQYLSKIEEVLKEGIQSGQFRKDLNTTSSGIAFFGMVQSLVTMWALGEYKSSYIQKNMPGLFEIYLKGIKA